MFLFTTPPVREPASSGPVVDAIREGAQRTGTGFDYLLATAQRESALDPAARARTSSATGLFQFVEQTWLGLVKAEGPKLGLTPYARAIATRADGSHTVDNPMTRRAILALRDDPRIASVMAGVLTQRNREALAADLGRQPSAGDVYVAHVLGARGAAQLIEAARQAPNRPAAPDFPEAAAANRNIFYDRNGRARGAGEVYAQLAAHHAALAGAMAAPAFGPERPLAFARTDGPAFHGLFRTEARRGPISEAVSRLWTTAAAPEAADGFFPRVDGRGEAAPAATATVPAAAPLPPPKPAAAEAAGPATTAARAGSRPAPLDLSSFMTWRKR
jgi:hypothetical protein